MAMPPIWPIAPPGLTNFFSEGWGYAALSYRGFGGSEGTPGEAANVIDALAVYDWVVAQGISPDRIIIFGESLGCAIAVRVAADRDAAGLFLQAPFDSALALARTQMPALLPDLILRDRYLSIDYIAAIDMPLLWLHGTADQVIPVSHGQRLFDTAVQPKQAIIVESAGHNTLFANEFHTHFVRPFVQRATRGE